MAQFTATISRFASQTEQRMRYTRDRAAQRVVRGVTQPTGAGGHMRVKTGFLRSSLMASTASMPQINPNARPPDDAADDSYQPDASAIALVIAGAELGEPINLGFVAAYAGPREFKDGFVRLTAQQWPQFVTEAEAEAIRAFPD